MLREMDKFTGILLLIQLNPIPVFGAKKITVHVPYDRKIFIESSIKMVSAQCLLLFLLHTYMCVYTLIIWLPFQPTTEPKVDNIRMAGYMEKLPVKSNQKKVHAVMKNPAMSIVHWSPSPVPCLIPRLCKGRLHQERCLYVLTTEIRYWWHRTMFTSIINSLAWLQNVLSPGCQMQLSLHDPPML